MRQKHDQLGAVRSREKLHTAPNGTISYELLGIIPTNYKDPPLFERVGFFNIQNYF
jgi:hypothetical protein